MLDDRNPLDFGPLLGQAHLDAVDALWRGYLETIRCWRPRLVNVLGETGVGKTRVVQEFYKRVVSSDPYWPKALLGLNQRKTVVPTQQTWKGSPTVLWLGLSCFALPDGRPWPVLEDGLRRQLKAHARGLLFRDRRSVAVRQAATKAATAVGSLLGAEAIKGLVDVASDIREVKEVAEALATDVNPDDGLVSGSDVIDAVLKIASLVNAEGQPVVIVLDDAHDADPLTLNAIERLLDKTQAVYIVTTSWPTAVSHQRQEDAQFGGWLTRIGPRPSVTSLALPPLSREVLAQMACKALARAGRDPVDLDAAVALGERARGNALVLSQLISMVIANDASVTRNALASLALLPAEPKEIFHEVWLRFLDPPVQTLLEAAAVLGTPVDEGMLLGATAEIRHCERTAFEREINDALVAGWLVAIPDPYSSRRRLRFSERLLAEVAAGFATQLIQPTRDRMVTHAALCAVDMPGSISVHARTAALEHATAMLEARMPTEASALAVTVFGELADLIWRRDRSRAAELMQSALRLELAQSREPEIGLLLNTSAALANIGEIDAALKVFNPRLPAAYLIMAEQANVHERFCEGYSAARDGLKAELAAPGAVAPNPIFDCDDPVILSLVTELCVGASYSRLRELEAEAKELLISVVGQLHATGQSALSSQVATVASDFGTLNRGDIAAVERLGVRVVHEREDELEADEFDRVVEADLLIAGGNFGEADQRLGGMPLYVRSQDAVDVAATLARLGGPQYARSLGRLALDCCRFTVALDAFEGAMRYELEMGQPLDAPRVQEIRSNIVESAVCAGEVDRAGTTSQESLDIARRAQNQYDIAKALLGIGYVHFAQRQFDDAERLLLAALRSLPHDAQSSIDAWRISAVRCDVYAARTQWTAIQDLLAHTPTSAFWHYIRHAWRLRGWRLVAGWRSSPDSVERSLLGDLDVPDRIARPALRAALEYLGREMDGPAGGASVLWTSGAVLLGLVGTLLEAGRNDLATPLLRHSSTS